MTDYKLFFDWLDSNEAVYPKLHLKHHTSEYRSICAKDNISSSDDILLIPEKLIITHEKSLQGPLNKKLSSKIDCEHTHFAIFLLEEKEKKDKSFWFPYINSLPKTYEDMPIFFDEEKLELVKGTLALKKIILRKQQLEQDYKSICSLEPEFSRFSLRDFTWGRLVTITRIFGFDIKGLKTSGLVPLADMLNHKKPDGVTNKMDTHWEFNDKKYGFLITARKNIKKDKEIYDSYGFKCNTRFFVNYGFTLEEDNSQDDESYITVLGSEFNVPGFYRKTREGEEKTRRMFTFMRIKCFENKTNSIDNQLKLLKILKSSVEKRFSEFKFSREEFKKLYEEEKIFSIKNCYRMCLSELGVLENYNKLCDFLIPALETKNYKKFMDKKCRYFVGTNVDLINEYVKECILPLILNA